MKKLSSQEVISKIYNAEFYFQKIKSKLNRIQLVHNCKQLSITRCQHTRFRTTVLG